SGRPLSIRLHAGSFFVGMRMLTSDTLTLSFGAHASQTVMLNDLDIADAALPILRLVSELTRTLILSDRTQAKNLRVRELRQRVRELGGAIKTRRRTATFVNRNPERVRLEHQLAEENQAHEERPMSALRFAERWRLSIDHLDPQQMFLCGDRIVLFT